MAAARPLQVAQQPRCCVLTGPKSSTARTPTPCKAAPRCCTTTAWPRIRAPACSTAWMKTPTSTPSASAKTSNTPCAKPSSCWATKRCANCARRRKPASRASIPARMPLDAGDLSLECLRLVYRLLFMFYIEARPELGYVPIQKSEIYLKGYSLESLRDLELTPLNTAARPRRPLFRRHPAPPVSLIGQGCGAAAHQQSKAGSVKEAFALAPLDSRLFDPAATPLLNQVRFPNHVWQRVIRLMSLSSGKGKGHKSGRVSYQLLSINQLGAVYEALLSYRGFFAPEDLYEVQPEPKKAAAASGGDDDDDEGEGRGADTAGRRQHRPAGQRLVRPGQPHRPATRPGERVHDSTRRPQEAARVPRAASSTAWPGATGRRAPATTPRRCSPAAWSNTRSRNCSRTRPPTTSSPSPWSSRPWAARRS
jgi:hypothetical protein